MTPAIMGCTERIAPVEVGMEELLKAIEGAIRKIVKSEIETWMETHLDDEVTARMEDALKQTDFVEEDDLENKVEQMFDEWIEDVRLRK